MTIAMLELKAPPHSMTIKVGAERETADTGRNHQNSYHLIHGREERGNLPGLPSNIGYQVCIVSTQNVLFFSREPPVSVLPFSGIIVLWI